jgi:hypothetical protein
MTKKKPLSDFNKAQQEFLTCKPSRLIEMAMEDLVKCEKSKKYRIEMGEWIAKKWSSNVQKEVCYVCLAGACVSQRFDIKHSLNASVGELAETIIDGHAEEVERRMEALDQFRLGYVADAIESMHIKVSDEVFERIKIFDDKYYIWGAGNRAIPQYFEPEENKEQNKLFKTNMKLLIEDLKELGL